MKPEARMALACFTACAVMALWAGCRSTQEPTEQERGSVEACRDFCRAVGATQWVFPTSAGDFRCSCIGRAGP